MARQHPSKRKGRSNDSDDDDGEEDYWVEGGVFFTAVGPVLCLLTWSGKLENVKGFWWTVFDRCDTETAQCDSNPPEVGTNWDEFGSPCLYAVACPIIFFFSTTESMETAQREKAIKKKKKKDKRRKKQSEDEGLFSPDTTITTTSRTSFEDSSQDNSTPTEIFTPASATMSDEKDKEIEFLKKQLAEKNKNEAAAPEELTETTAAKAVTSAAKTATGNKKMKVCEEDKAEWTVLRDAIVLNVFNKMKFVFGKYEETALDKIFLAQGRGHLVNPKTHENFVKRAQYKEYWMDMIHQIFNDKRSYVNTRIKDACYAYMAAGNGKLPTVEEIEGILKRDEKVVSEELFRWWWDKILPVSAGHGKHFQKNVRLYHVISDTENGVTVYNEAFAACIIINQRNRWEFVHKNKPLKVKWFQKRGNFVPQVDPGCTVAFWSEHPDKVPKFTNLKGGNQKEGGWTDHGIRTYGKYRDMLKKARKTPESKAMEMKTLMALREAYGIVTKTADDHNKKKAARSVAGKARLEDVCLIDSSDEEEVKTELPPIATKKGGKSAAEEIESEKEATSSKKKDLETKKDDGKSDKDEEDSEEEEEVDIEEET